MYQRSLRPDELMHYGVIGMKWGVRRYQNPDGTLTVQGMQRYGKTGDKPDIDKSTKSARMTKKSLNYLEKQRRKQKANANENFAEADKIRRGKTANTKAGKKAIDKFTKQGKAYLTNSKEISRLMHDVISTAESKGQKVTAGKDIKKYINSGEQLAAIALGTAIAGMPLGAILGAYMESTSPSRLVSTRKYKVSKQ